MTFVASVDNVEVQNIKGVNKGSLEAMGILTGQEQFMDYVSKMVASPTAMDVSPTEMLSPTTITALQPSNDLGWKK